MNRFVDTNIWKKPWYRQLAPGEKCAWKYITDSCDNVGVWDADFELAEFCIGEHINWSDFVDRVNGNIKVLENGKWWLVDFCAFQHPDLNERSESKPIKSYVALLKKHNLWETYLKAMLTLNQGYPEGMDTFQGKGIGKGKGTGKEQEQEPPEIWEDETIEKSAWLAFEKGYGTFMPDRSRQLDAIHKLLHEATARGDPGEIIPQMMEKLKELKNSDNSRKGFWRDQPFLPATLVALFTQIWEKVRNDEPEEEIPF